MLQNSKFVSLIFIILISSSCKNKTIENNVNSEAIESAFYQEPYRSQFHFTPEENWMNDPNGMVYYKGVYHLFYQYYPDDIVWGPMHWGHAISNDLIHWKHKPIALYPDKHGLIFSGSAVVDQGNSSGFGTVENPPLVAIFTYHLMEGEKLGRTDFQTQGIAYSLDNGDTWVKYDGNPVLGNEGIKDFRDPKVMWHEATKKWIMTLVAGNHAKFYGSKDLKEWQLLEEFGRDKGAHGGVWECPDLFPLPVDDTEEEKWILLISVNPGAPNGGSGTQYFVGDFDGITFSTEQTEIKWIDHGTDNYAGVTYSNAPSDERIFIGWMSNWSYARDTPTEKWRSAMTVPRKLSLKKTGEVYELYNYPVENFEKILLKSDIKKVIVKGKSVEKIGVKSPNQSEISFTTTSKDFKLTLSNSLNEHLVLSMLGDDQTFFLDRSKSGQVDFQEDFGEKIQQMPVAKLPEGNYEVRIIIDWSSIEIFINKGQYVMTAQLFPNEHYSELSIENLIDKELVLSGFTISDIKSIW